LILWAGLSDQMSRPEWHWVLRSRVSLIAIFNLPINGIFLQHHVDYPCNPRHDGYAAHNVSRDSLLVRIENHRGHKRYGIDYRVQDVRTVSSPGTGVNPRSPVEDGDEAPPKPSRFRFHD